MCLFHLQFRLLFLRITDFLCAVILSAVRNCARAQLRGNRWTDPPQARCLCINAADLHFSQFQLSVCFCCCYFLKRCFDAFMSSEASASLFIYPEKKKENTFMCRYLPLQLLVVNYLHNNSVVITKLITTS